MLLVLSLGSPNCHTGLKSLLFSHGSVSTSVLFCLAWSTDMPLCDPPPMIIAISGWIQFYNVTIINVSYLFIFLNLPSQKLVFKQVFCCCSLSSLLVYVIWWIVAIICSTWICSEVADIYRLSNMEVMPPLVTTAFALWYLVFPALRILVSLRSWYMSPKKKVIIHVFSNAIFFLHICQTSM